MTPETILKTKFGYDNFRGGQKEIIDAALQEKNVLAIMPTGGGKSLCYQIPALLFPGVTMVISPLISLMKDQVDALNENGIAATFINSTLTATQIKTRLAELTNGTIKILYVSPERLDSGYFNLLSRLPIDLVAIDEAHCISQWGHDFRPSYLTVTEIIKKLPSQPTIMALTATATPKVAKDIMQRLEISKKVQTDFSRPNLAFQVVKNQDSDRFLLDYLKINPTNSGIIYASTRKEVERIYSLLTHKKIIATKYHAGLSASERQNNQEDFLYDRTPVMVATNAFGMGIDKSNVRFVIHAQVPGTLEAYYQEAGRAGRDGLDSDVILLFKLRDVQIQHFFIQQNEMDEKNKQQAFLKLQEMTTYANTEDCLPQFILKYFGEVTASCGKCSNCLDNREQQEITLETQKILSCVKRMNQRFGKVLVAQVLTGSRVQKIKDLHFDQLSTFGILKDQSQKSVSETIDYLVAAGFLQAVGGQYPVLNITPRGLLVLTGQEKVFRKMAATVKKVSLEVDGDLFEELRSLRRQLAEEQHVPPFVIFSDQTLKEMCTVMPKTLDDLLDIKGIGESKRDKYGQVFLEVIQQKNAALQ
ncbi:DNA helicase RecQ [Enterococcus timonensis]|uniref:DNA helicase RecQ n=1 Tax=Enterococcus timonensis TaxID=1852364 RepID=UPI0008DB2260|nr:DNA helicase RecQ [Enterococcus timonensis]